MYADDPELRRLPSNALIVTGAIALLALLPVGGWAFLVSGWWAMYGESTPPQLPIALVFLVGAAVGAVLAICDQVFGAVMVLVGGMAAGALMLSTDRSDPTFAAIGAMIIGALGALGAVLGQLQHVMRSQPRPGGIPSTWGPPPPGYVMPQPQPPPVPPPGRSDVDYPTRRLP